MPPGPTDAEVEAELLARVEALSQAVVAGATDEMLGLFAEDARMRIENVNGVSAEASGHADIRALVRRAGTPPTLSMTVQMFERTGDSAAQAGVWDVSGLTGSFNIVWERTDESWRITGFDFIG